MLIEYENNIEFNQEDLVVLFYASYNVNCNVSKELFNRLSENYPNVMFLKVNTTRYYELKTYFKISRIPTYLYLKKGNIVGRLDGNQSNYSLNEFIKRNI